MDIIRPLVPRSGANRIVYIRVFLVFVSYMCMITISRNVKKQRFFACFLAKINMCIIWGTIMVHREECAWFVNMFLLKKSKFGWVILCMLWIMQNAFVEKNIVFLEKKKHSKSSQNFRMFGWRTFLPDWLLTLCVICSDEKEETTSFH